LGLPVVPMVFLFKISFVDNKKRGRPQWTTSLPKRNFSGEEKQ